MAGSAASSGAGAGAGAAQVVDNDSDSSSDSDERDSDNEGRSWFNHVTCVTKFDKSGNPPLNSKNNPTYARKCNICSTVMKCPGKGTETTTICRHFREKGKSCPLHKEIHRAIIDNSSHSHTNTTSAGETVPVRRFAEDFENLNRASCCIINDNLALQTGESPNFRNYTIGLDANHRPPTAEHVFDFAETHA